MIDRYKIYDDIIKNKNNNINIYDSYDVELITLVNAIKNNNDLVVIVCKNGYINVLKYLHTNKFTINTKWAFYNAARYNHLECLKYLNKLADNIIRMDTDIVETAAFHHNLECTEFLVENNYAFDDDTIKMARRGGSVLCYNYLMENDHLVPDIDKINIYDLMKMEGIPIPSKSELDKMRQDLFKML